MDRRKRTRSGLVTARNESRSKSCQSRGLNRAEVESRIGWAPSNASFQAHIARCETFGARTGESLAQRHIRQRTRRLPKELPQVRAVSKGEIDVGWVKLLSTQLKRD